MSSQAGQDLSSPPVTEGIEYKIHKNMDEKLQ